MRTQKGADEAAVTPLPTPRQLAPGLAFEETEQWYTCGSPVKAAQGWKLYASLTMLNAHDAIERLVPLVVAAGLQFKYVKDLRVLRKLNAGVFGYPQIGKCFVVYMPETDAALVEALKHTLARYRDDCPAVPCALAFGAGLPLHYRYGAYRGDQIEVAGVRVPDDRTSLQHAVPDGIEDALAAFREPVSIDTRVTAFLQRFPTFRAIAQSGKCGIFHSMNLESSTFQEVALKVGYHRGQVQPDGSDGCAFLRGEVALYRLLRDRGLEHVAPAMIASLDVPGKVILALEYVNGTSLLACKLAGRLAIEHLERAWAILDEIHAASMYVGDAKLANFLLRDDGELRVIDLEAGGCLAGKTPPPLGTFFINPALADPRAADKAHFLASILFSYDEGRYSWEDRHVDLVSWLRQGPDDELSAWALARADDLLRSCGLVHRTTPRRPAVGAPRRGG